MNSRSVTLGSWLLSALMLLPAPATTAAQSLARVSLDSAVSIDQFVGQNTVDQPNVVIDVTAVARLADGWIGVLPPVDPARSAH